MNDVFAFELFTDGACSGNPGPGGFGVVICRGGIVHHELHGGEMDTTNNRMEMLGVITGVEHAAALLKDLEAFVINPLDMSKKILVTTDSKYVIDGTTKWVDGWKKNGWKTKNKQPVKNQDLWIRLDELRSKFDLTFKWVRGHSGHVMNERADELARQGIIAGSPLVIRP